MPPPRTDGAALPSAHFRPTPQGYPANGTPPVVEVHGGPHDDATEPGHMADLRKLVSSWAEENAKATGAGCIFQVCDVHPPVQRTMPACQQFLTELPLVMQLYIRLSVL